MRSDNVAHRYSVFGSAAALAALTALVMVIVGCSKPPDGQAARVRLRFQQSDTSDCARLVPQIYTAARDSFQAADSDMAVQARAFIIQRSYGRAERLLSFSDSVLTVAIDSAAEIVRRFRAEVGPLKEQAAETLRATAVKMDSLEARLGRTNDLEALRGQLVSLRILLARADSRLAAGQSVDATMDYNTVLTRAREITASLGQYR